MESFTGGKILPSVNTVEVYGGHELKKITDENIKFVHTARVVSSKQPEEAAAQYVSMCRRLKQHFT